MLAAMSKTLLYSLAVLGDLVLAFVFYRSGPGLDSDDPRVRGRLLCHRCDRQRAG
jgi:hypothetical protein